MSLTPGRRALLGLASGLAIAFSLPPWGWWPLAFVGTALLTIATRAPSRWSRFGAGMVVGVAWLGIGMAWMWFLTPPGYIVATLLFAAFHGIAAMATPTDGSRLWAGPILHTLAEAIRFSFPFGGVPLATLAIGLSASPLLFVVRLGGTLLLTWFVFQAGAVAAEPRFRTHRTGLGLAALVSVIVTAAAAPSGSDYGRPVEVAAVQGGGKQGTTALEVPVADVFAVHLDATRSIPSPDRAQSDSAGRERPALQLVTWPENGIGMTGRTSFADSPWRDDLARESARLGVPILFGLTEDIAFSNHPTDADSFVNAQVVMYPDGSLGDRYEKVQIVPFGEYVPLRGLLTALGVDLSLVGRDATRGRDPAQLHVELRPNQNDPGTGDPDADDPDQTADQVTVGVMISWEVFFGHRGRAAAANGADFLLNPTNGSSYTGTILQTQQVASSRLRAAENGRWVVQDSPTGFTAFVGPDGNVIDRTGIGEQAVIRFTVPRRRGTTIYHAVGDLPWVMLLLLGTAAIIGRRWYGQRAPRPGR